MPEREEREQEIGSLFEKIMKEISPDLVKERLTIPGSTAGPKQNGCKRSTPRCIIIKMPKVKDKKRLLKAAREKKLVTYRGAPRRLSAYFSKETVQATRDWQEIFKVMKRRTYSLECSIQQSYHLES